VPRRMLRKLGDCRIKALKYATAAILPYVFQLLVDIRTRSSNATLNTATNRGMMFSVMVVYSR
jgi:hypothetical protein